MGISWLSIPLLVAFATPAYAQPQAGMPLMNAVEPASGVAGDVITVQGANLGQANVAALYLTDGTNDYKVVMVEQKPASIRFKIPSEAKPGRLALMVLTGSGKDQKLIEQPVRLTVEAGSVT
jgi:hypothetical protein